MTSPDLITLTDPRSAAAEAYRTLRTNLLFRSVEMPVRTLAMTSPYNTDDKSIALANLAVTLAQTGSHTILVDCDLRRPVQHGIWGIANERGLSAMMLEDAALANPPLAESGVANLSILPAGMQAPNPADLLSSQRMNELIGVLRARAAYVLFDSPPVLVATDAALLGVKLDGVIMAIRAGQTRRDQTERARSTLQQVNVRILGAVLTNAPRERASSY